MSTITSTSGRLHSEFIRLLFLQDHRETDWFLQFQEFSFLKPTVDTKVRSTLTKTSTLRINLNVDGVPITSRTHTQSSHSQTSRLFTSSLSLGVPVPRSTQCNIIRVMYVSVKTRVTPTSETVVGDEEVHHQRHRVRRVRKVVHQFNIPTMSTPDLSNVFRLGFMS